MNYGPLFAASVPPWAWAALLMAVFVGVTIVTMLLTRYPVRRAPPPALGERDRAPPPDKS